MYALQHAVETCPSAIMHSAEIWNVLSSITRFVIKYRRANQIGLFQSCPFGALLDKCTQFIVPKCIIIIINKY